jgi:hypothetical protein
MANKYFMTIINESPLPVNVETWQACSWFGLSEMKSITLKKDDRIIMVSETGEWHVNSFIHDKNACAEWELFGYTIFGYTMGKVIGKFRSEPAIGGKNVWMCDDKFQIECSNGIAKITLNTSS